MADSGGIHEFHRLDERPRIVATVVDHAGGRVVRKLVRPNQVGGAHLHRVPADLPGKHVDRSLDGQDPFWSPGPAVRPGGSRIGDDGTHFNSYVLHVVGSGSDQRGPCGHDESVHRIRSEIPKDPNVDAAYSSVPLAGHLDGLSETPTVIAPAHVLST